MVFVWRETEYREGGHVISDGARCHFTLMAADYWGHPASGEGVPWTVGALWWHQYVLDVIGSHTEIMCGQSGTPRYQLLMFMC